MAPDSGTKRQRRRSSAGQLRRAQHVDVATVLRRRVAEVYLTRVDRVAGGGDRCGQRHHAPDVTVVAAFPADATARVVVVVAGDAQAG